MSQQGKTGMYRLKVAGSGGTYLPKGLREDLGILRETDMLVSAATIGDKKVIMIVSDNTPGEASAQQTS